MLLFPDKGFSFWFGHVHYFKLVLEYRFERKRAPRLIINMIAVKITAEAKALSLTSGMGSLTEKK